MSELDQMLGHDRAPLAPDRRDVAVPVGLPMPRDPGLLGDPSRRVRVTQIDRGYRFPVPNGWFIVARSDELRPGDVRPLHYFERDLVVYRSESGEPHVLDAHCTHLGAHLAVGGKVEGNCIRCPFHGWKFDGADGSCAEIPYGGSTRIPSRAPASGPTQPLLTPIHTPATGPTTGPGSASTTGGGAGSSAHCSCANAMRAHATHHHAQRMFRLPSRSPR